MRQSSGTDEATGRYEVLVVLEDALSNPYCVCGRFLAWKANESSVCTILHNEKEVCVW